jgi:hypothetical protein
MWDYYDQGYTPRWLRLAEFKDKEGPTIRTSLYDILSKLEPNHILYLEDPFGKTEYESKEALERGIGVIIDRVRQVDRLFVIITSREEVFKQFGTKRLSATDLNEFEQRLNLKRPSYDYEKRRQILLNLAGKEGCAWLGHKNLEELVLKEVKEGRLPTPFNLRDFAIASARVSEGEELKRIGYIKSEETAKVFAREIGEMTRDKQLFLTFPFIGHIEIGLTKETYQALVANCGERNPMNFEAVSNWFEDKIRIAKSLLGYSYIEFSHPSYSEALPHLLKDDQGFHEIFNNTLLKLSEKDSAAWAVAWNFDYIPKRVRQKLLSGLSEKVRRLLKKYPGIRPYLAP